MIDRFLHDIHWVLPLRHDLLTPIMQGFTFLGYPTFVTLFLALLFWLWNKDAASRLVIIVIISSIINGFLKDFWLNPRPDIALQLDPEVNQSYGMPSGHAQVAAVLWLWLAYEMRQLGHGIWVWFGAIFIMIMICFSRIYLGVHDIEDIIAGLGIAVILLILYYLFLMPKFQWFRDLSVSYHLVLIIIFMIFLYWAWPGLDNILNPSIRPSAQSFEILSTGALLLGWIYGRQIEENYMGFTIKAKLWGMPYIASWLAMIAGVISIFLLLRIMDYLFVNISSGGFISLIILGLYITIGAPSLFKALRLAR